MSCFVERPLFPHPRIASSGSRAALGDPGQRDWFGFALGVGDAMGGVRQLMQEVDRQKEAIDGLKAQIAEMPVQLERADEDRQSVPAVRRTRNSVVESPNSCVASVLGESSGGVLWGNPLGESSGGFPGGVLNVLGWGVTPPGGNVLNPGAGLSCRVRVGSEMNYTFPGWGTTSPHPKGG